MSLLLSTRADCEVGQLAEALAAVYEQHDGLRLRFHESNGGWRQEHAETAQLSLERVDLSDMTAEAQRETMEREAEAAQASLNLSAGPLVRAIHFNLGEGEAGRLLLVMHHLVVDGVSWRILIEDIERAYEQAVRGEQVALGSKSSSYGQWATALQEYAQSGEAKEELKYWSEQEWARAERLRCDDGSADNSVRSARSVERTLSSDETSALLQQVPELYRTQINEVLLTALGRALGKWQGEGSVVVDVEGHGREEVVEGIDLSRTVGWFTSIYPLLLRASAQEELSDALKRVKEEVRGIPQRGIGYGVLKYLSEDQEVQRRMNEIPVGEVSFNYLGQFDRVMESGGLLAAAEESVGPSQGAADKLHHLLSFNGRVTGGQLSMVWSFSENVYRPLTVEKLAESYIEALREIITHCRAEHEMRADTTRATESKPRSWSRASYKDKAEKNSYPLTSMQEIMAAQSLATPGAGIYTPQLSLHINGLQNPATFRRAWEQVVQRHSVFSTSLFWDEQGRAFQGLSEQWVLPFDQQDWRDVAPNERQERLQALLAEDRRRGFELSQAPLMRLALIRLSENTYNFIWTHHHLLLDGWSAAALLKEVFACYEAFERGEDLQFEESRPFSRYLSWLQRQDASAADAFWRKMLRGFTAPTPLPFRRTNLT
ncbi:MAG TPA: condensation domain-containing protein, partial [Pyrinomonadaceae bacterium]